VLVIHGSGGGFDQGGPIARASFGDGLRWIAPSRFGRLRSGVPAGVAVDNRAALQSQHIAGIRAPTLILHARDDTLQPCRHAEFAAATIPGARLLPFEHGGHLLLAGEMDRLRAEVQAFVLARGGP
jgi:pimeloyl-ACP methyl ester carboxylesterase